MSQELDSIFRGMSAAATMCYDLNGNGLLTNAEQTVFYQYAEHINFLLNEMHGRYDALSTGLAGDVPGRTEIAGVWAAANTDLGEFARSTTSPKLRAAVASTAFAIDRTSSIISSV